MQKQLHSYFDKFDGQEMVVRDAEYFKITASRISEWLVFYHRNFNILKLFPTLQEIRVIILKFEPFSIWILKIECELYL